MKVPIPSKYTKYLPMSMIAPEEIATPGLKGQELLWLQVTSGSPLPQKSHVHSGYMYTNEGPKCEVTN